MSGRGRGSGGGGGRGAYYKAKYGGGGNRGRDYQRPESETNHPPYPSESQQTRYQSRPLDGQTSADLSHLLNRLDGKSYPAYKDLYGTWTFTEFSLHVDYIQGDAYASPSKFRVQIPHVVASIPPHLWDTPVRAVATRDFLARTFADAVSRAGGDIRKSSSGWHGAKGGEMAVDRPSQQVLDRTAVMLTPDYVEARFTLALPASGRSILGRMAHTSLVDMLPRYVQQGLNYHSLDIEALQRHVSAVEDADSIRQHLPSMGLVAFVGAGSVLPRRSGASDEPMPAQDAIPFVSPATLEVEVPLSGGRSVRGMGIPHGVTLICGGGFHGKSTLLKAIERGVYNHIPGDGRELVITNPSAVKIRAEDGRNVGCVDISTFIDNLPHGKQTNAFSSSDASGSTSQAANIQEALEAGSTCLLLDEDTCATNFMIRDARMQLLVAGDKEPIKPFISRVRALAGCGISSILVVGGCGEYFDVADLVVSMDEFRPIDTTARAKEISAQFITAEQARILGENERFVIPGRALASPRVVANALHRNVGKIMVRNKSLVQFGDLELDLSCVEQIVDSSQTRAIADALRYIQGHLLECGANRGDGVNMVKAMSVAEILDSIEAAFASGGMDVLSIEGRVAGNYALPRRYEIAAALNRIRSATFSQQK